MNAIVKIVESFLFFLQHRPDDRHVVAALLIAAAQKVYSINSYLTAAR